MTNEKRQLLDVSDLEFYASELENEAVSLIEEEVLFCFHFRAETDEVIPNPVHGYYGLDSYLLVLKGGTSEIVKYRAAMRRLENQLSQIKEGDGGYQGDYRGNVLAAGYFILGVMKLYEGVHELRNNGKRANTMRLKMQSYFEEVCKNDPQLFSIIGVASLIKYLQKDFNNILNGEQVQCKEPGLHKSVMYSRSNLGRRGLLDRL